MIFSDTGKPTYQMEFDIILDPVMFKARYAISNVNPGLKEFVRNTGLAIYTAEKLFSYPIHFTDRGYLLRGFVTGLTRKKAHIEINNYDNLHSLLTLEKKLEDKTETDNILCFYYGENNSPNWIKAKDGHLYSDRFNDQKQKRTEARFLEERARFLNLEGKLLRRKARELVS